MATTVGVGAIAQKSTKQFWRVRHPGSVISRAVRIVAPAAASVLALLGTATQAVCDPPQYNPADLGRLMGMLPRGYSPANCAAGVSPLGEIFGLLAAVNCTLSTDPQGPSNASFILVETGDFLYNTWHRSIVNRQPVACTPNREPSLGAWVHRSGAPGGQYACINDPTVRAGANVVWTDPSNLMQGWLWGPNSIGLYQWWSQNGCGAGVDAECVPVYPGVARS